MSTRILVINIGSTSSKIAIYDDQKALFTSSISHSREELSKFADVMDQYEWRKDLILKELEKNRIDPATIGAIACRGGLLPPPKVGLVNAGAYEINDDMLYVLRYHPQNPHPTNMGAAIADSFAKDWHIKAYIYDPPTVDEMIPITKITGQPGMTRRGQGHPLNMRAAALKYAKSIGKPYESLNLAIVHLGGGITLSLHSGGKMIDFITDDEGPFAPERSGGLPGFQLAAVVANNHWTEKEALDFMQRRGGLKAYFNTVDSRDVEAMIDQGDQRAELVYHAMALNVAKNLAKLAVTVSGNLDQIILTGGIAFSKRFTGWVTDYVKFIAPVTIIPGENEIEALALGILRVVRGEETAQIYVKQDYQD